MGVKSFLIKPYAAHVARKVRFWRNKPLEAQNKVFKSLVCIAKTTSFGRDHDFAGIKSHEDFCHHVPILEYEQIKDSVERIKSGEKDVLWPGKPIYFAKTSGTTSGMKIIPITRDSIDNHFYSAQTALFLYIVESGRSKLMDGRMIFLSGSPELEMDEGIPSGRLSGIVNHQVPPYLRANQLPSYQTNCIEDWEDKVDRIVEETVDQNMTLISGIPPWVQMYFDKLSEKTGKPIKEIFPNFEVFAYGGVNYEPYRAKLERTIGKRIPSIETYPASEGFIAFQDSQHEEGLLLNVDSGIFFEFVPAEEIYHENPTRLGLKDVELNVNYAIIISSNAGLWGYNLGDTVKFVSVDPYRIVVTGRVKHFISAFGEHVIVEEVESCLNRIIAEEGLDVVEFTVAPHVNPEGELPYHEWLVEFTGIPENVNQLALRLDHLMCEKNLYYGDLIKGRVLQPLKLRALRESAFKSYMKDKGKLGGQNKVPRLANDRSIADDLTRYLLN